MIFRNNLSGLLKPYLDLFQHTPRVQHCQTWQLDPVQCVFGRQPQFRIAFHHQPPVESTLMLDIGRRPLELKAWPGAHTNNDLTIYDRATGTLWLSDLLFVERTPSIDGDIRGWIGVIDELSQVTARITVPGHGKVTDDKQQALNNQKRYLTILLGDVRKAIQSGTPMEVAMQQAAGTERSGWVLFDAVNRRNVNLIYPQLEWE